MVDTTGTHEKEVFLEFVRGARLLIDPASIASRPPPEPDIYCVDESGPVYFELGRLLDPEMQRMRLHAMRRAPEQVACADYDVKLPERQMLTRKIAKTYQTGNVPVELLLYYDNTNWLVGDVPAVPDFAAHAECVMRPPCEIQRQFRQVWVFERHQKTVLWSYRGRHAD
jgi:hypothetical protein